MDVDKFADLLKKEFQKEIIRMELVDRGELLSAFNNFRIEGNKIVFVLPDYAEALEYGSYALGSMTRETSPKGSSTKAKSLKKKDMSREMSRKLPKGMVAFAFLRRVIYNEKLMEDLVSRS